MMLDQLVQVSVSSDCVFADQAVVAPSVAAAAAAAAAARSEL